MYLKNGRMLAIQGCVFYDPGVLLIGTKSAQNFEFHVTDYSLAVNQYKGLIHMENREVYQQCLLSFSVMIQSTNNIRAANTPNAGKKPRIHTFT